MRNGRQTVAAHSTWPSIAFIRAAYDDVRVDGLLDGRGPAGAVALGNLALTADVYRATLSERLMQFVVSNKNNTTLGFDGVLPFADTLNAFAGGLFASSTGHSPSTWLGERLWGIIPAAPFLLGFLASFGLFVYYAVSDAGEDS